MTKKINIVGKTLAVALALVIALSSFVTCFAAKTDSAAVGEDVEITMYFADEPSFVPYDLNSSENQDCMIFEAVINDKQDSRSGIAFCSEPFKENPPMGTAFSAGIEKINDAVINNILYYGYKGPGLDTYSMVFSSGNSGFEKTPRGAMLFYKNRYGISVESEDAYIYIFTHLALAYALNNIEFGGAYSNYEKPVKTYVDRIIGGRIVSPEGDFHSADKHEAVNSYLIITDDNYQNMIVYDLNKTPKETLTMTKRSANPELTEGNACYSLAGARYGVYTSKEDAEIGANLKGEIVTNAEGNGNYVDAEEGAEITMGDYWAKELEASPGYKLDKTIHQFQDTGEVTENGVPIYSFESVEKPSSDPMLVFIKKVDAVTGMGNADLAGAQFEVKYYDSIFTAINDIPDKAPLRTWVFKTNANGTVAYKEDFKVSGDDLYVVDDIPSLPIGTVTIQEISAPTSGKYKVNNEIYVRQVARLAEVDADLEPVNPFVVNEVPNVSGLTIKKTSSDGTIDGIWFRVESDNGFKKDYVTNEGGVISVTGLDVTNSKDERIKYTVTELGFKKGDTYLIPKKYTPIPSISQTVTLDEKDNVEVAFHNKEELGDFTIIKKSDDGVVKDIVFQITGSNGFTKKVQTNGDGIANVSNLPILDNDDNLITYTVSEIGFRVGVGESFPDRYYHPADYSFTFDNADSNKVSKSHTFENVQKYGKIKIVKEETDGEIEGVAFTVTSLSDAFKFSKDYVTNEKGICETENLPVYDKNDKMIPYQITEKGYWDDASQQYKMKGYHIKPEDQIVTLKDSKESETIEVTFNNVKKFLNIKIEKLADDDIIKDVWFNVRANDGSYDKNFATDDKGEIVIEKLLGLDKDGHSIDYIVTELGFKQADGSYKLSERYYVLDSQTIIGSAAMDLKQVHLVFKNRTIRGNITVKKTATDGKVDGIWFAMTDSLGNTYDNMPTNEKGEVTFKDLKVYNDNNEKIEYTFTELGEKQEDGTFKIPNRYNTVPSQTVTLEENSNHLYTNEVAFDNTLKHGSVEVLKIDKDTQEPMGGVTFELYKKDGTLVGEKTTVGDGTAKFEDLEIGDYYFVETKTVPGHNLVEGKIEFTISGDSEETLHRQLVVKNTNIPEIPNTGSNSFIYLIIGGCAVIVAGIIIIIFMKKKKK